jgi:putative copper export protein
VARLLLRVAHAIAAAVWLGGGVYYLLALRPQLRKSDGEVRAFARNVQREFGEWASVSTLIMIATGVVLMFDRLTDGRGTEAYVLLLGVKVAAAVTAFWLARSFRRRKRPVEKAATGGESLIDRAWLMLSLGAVAFILGITLSSLYSTGIGQG